MGYKRPLKAIGSNGVLMGYLLTPVILSGSREWVGHLLILVLLWTAVIFTVALAFRCGADRRQAMLAGLIFASTPVVLGMAGTVMPDIPATALAVFGIERLLAWKEERKIHQALAAGVALGLAPLGRSHTLLLLPIAALMLVDGSLWPISWRKVREMGFVRWLPIVLAAFCFVFITWLTFDQAPTAVLPAAPNADQVGWENIALNLPAFGIDWLLTTTLAVTWMLLDGWRGILTLAAIVLAGQAARFFLPYPTTVISLALAGLWALQLVLVEAWQSGKRILFWLALWLLIPLPIVFYVHLPAKYLAASAPAAAILLAWKLSALTARRQTIAASLMIVAGAALGVAILKADADFAGSARQVIADEIAPHIQAGGQAWFYGQWALNWYADKAGANCMTTDPPYPHRGDLLISDELDGGIQVVAGFQGFPKHLLRTISPGGPGGRIYDPSVRAGFYTNHTGYWPWRWSNGPLNTYYVWEFE